MNNSCGFSASPPTPITTKTGIVRDMPNFENMESFGYTLLQTPLESLIISYPIQGLKSALDEIPQESLSEDFSQSFSESISKEKENEDEEENESEENESGEKEIKIKEKHFVLICVPIEYKEILSETLLQVSDIEGAEIIESNE